MTGNQYLWWINYAMTAPKTLVARMAGGPLPMSNLIRAPEAKVVVGETIGYLGWVSKENAGYAVLDDFLILRDVGSGKFVHGQFFHGPVWTKQAVALTVGVNIAAQPACPLDVESEATALGAGAKGGGK
ncbi:MAG: hypothetical protein FJ100_13955 [Deltaproteobacteria bacterium]|nr:hypothetical protein [Deltaproteobacteria bacterium]